MGDGKAMILVRHAQSQHHVLRLTGGWTDTPLTELGHEQSRRVARRLRDELGLRKVRVYSSDLLRAMETAQHVAEAFGIRVVPDERLREHNNGECAGLTIEDAKARWPDMWTAPTPLDGREFPGAETPREFYERAGSFIDGFAHGESLPIVVTHGGTVVCLVARWLGLSAEVLEPIGFSAHTTGITLLTEDRHGRRIERLNDTAHLSAVEGQVLIGEVVSNE